MTQFSPMKRLLLLILEIFHAVLFPFTGTICTENLAAVAPGMCGQKQNAHSHNARSDDSKYLSFVSLI